MENAWSGWTAGVGLRGVRWLVCAAAACAAGCESLAAEGVDRQRIDADVVELLGDPGFLDAHPDLRWRGRGVEALEDRRHRAAMTYFRRAARYADKPSQAMIAEMLWKGEGGEPDRGTAYAWMDLAAERGYPAFLAMRERYWNGLAAAERVRALEAGGPLYDEFGDDVAKSRLERVLDRARRNVTGSRLGITGTLKVQVYGPGGWTTMDGSVYFRPQLWNPDLYWEWQDSVWRAPPRGRVSVGPISAPPAEPPPHP